MPPFRSIVQVHAAAREDIADLVTRRPLPGPKLNRLGAFLSLNHHGPQTYGPGNGGLPFGPHPHRGFETVTFILEGELAHRDSAGHESVIHAGGVQWMTAGSGLVHAEISPDAFKRQGGRLEILQLWVNLPARLKMTPPKYIGLQGEQIPTLVEEAAGSRVHLISGSFRGHAGPIHSLTGVFMSTLDVDAGGKIQLDGLEGRDVFCYVARGEIGIDGSKVGAFNLIQLSDGESVILESGPGAYVVLGHADPLDEPVVAYGPFVMNTEAQIRQAYADYRSGRLGSQEMC